MNKAKRVLKTIEYELPLFILLAFKLPHTQLWPYGPPVLLLAGGLAVLGGALVRRAGEAREAVLLLLALALAGDMMRAVLVPQTTSTEVLLAKTASTAAFLLAVLFVRRAATASKPAVFGAALTVLCGAGVLLNPAFLLFFLPPISILLVYEKQNNKRASPPLFPVLAGIAGAAVHLFIPSVQGIRQLGIISAEYVFTVNRPAAVLRAAMLYVPLAAVFLWVWGRVRAQARTRAPKTAAVLGAVLPLCTVVVSFFVVYGVSDGWRYYMAAAAFGQFVILLYLLDARDPAVCAPARDLARAGLRRPWVPLLLIVYAIAANGLLYPR